MSSLQMWKEEWKLLGLPKASCAVLWPYSVPETGPSAPRLHLSYLGAKGLQGL